MAGFLLSTASLVPAKLSSKDEARGKALSNARTQRNIRPMSLPQDVYILCQNKGIDPGRRLGGWGRGVMGIWDLDNQPRKEEKGTPGPGAERSQGNHWVVGFHEIQSKRKRAKIHW